MGAWEPPSATSTIDPPAGDRPSAPVASLRWWQGALAGLVAAGAALGVAQLVSGLLRGTTSPVVSVGEWVIDHVPVAVKEFAIRQFGTNDKPMLILGTVVVLGIFAVVIGILAVRRLWIGIAGIVLFGLIGVSTAVTRPSAPLSPPSRPRSAPSPPWPRWSSCSRGSLRPRDLDRSSRLPHHARPPALPVRCGGDQRRRAGRRAASVATWPSAST